MSAPGSPQRARGLRIIERLIERTNADQLAWERAAPPESWAVDIAQTRFRIYPEPGERPTYVVEFLGAVGESFKSDEADAAGLVEALYQAADANGKRHTPDPLAQVEEQLGLTQPENPAG